jgi:hypothetical protein
MGNNTNTTPTRPSHKGILNPMAGRHHSLATRQRQSKSHLRYQEKVRQALKVNQQASPLSMGQFLESPELMEYITRIIKEELQKLQL